MLEIEYVALILGQLFSVVVAVWVILNSHKLAGFIMLFSFLVIIGASYIQIFSDVVEFIPMEEGGVFFDVEVKAPLWYKLVMVLRTIASLALPLGIWLAVKNAKAGN